MANPKTEGVMREKYYIDNITMADLHFGPMLGSTTYKTQMLLDAKNEPQTFSMIGPIEFIEVQNTYAHNILQLMLGITSEFMNDDEADVRKTFFSMIKQSAFPSISEERMKVQLKNNAIKFVLSKQDIIRNKPDYYDEFDNPITNLITFERGSI